MTDDEIAEKWLDERYLKDMAIRRPCKQAILAGLKAGKDMNVPTKWHDLRKNPNDLPRDYEIVLNQDGNETTYTSKRGFLGFGGIGLIAWCEKPKFEEK